MLAELYCADGDSAAAVPLYEEALTLTRAMGNLQGITVNLFNLARTSIEAGLDSQARAMLREAIAYVDANKSEQTGQQLLVVAAGLAALRKEWERAARFHGAAEADLEKRNSRREPADVAFFVPLAARARDALGAATFGIVEDTGRALGYPDAVAEIRDWLESG
jgi:hypothetical protein